MSNIYKLMLKYITTLYFCTAVCRALKCFHCQDSPYPRDCVHVATCSRGDVCYTEAVISVAGEIVYHTGCLPIQHCPNNITTTNSKKRYSDVTTCVDCCDSDFCNNKGCGTSDIPRDQRGPYCYSCEATWQNHMCNKVVICPRNSLCATHTPKDFFYVPEVVFQSSCVSKPMCSTLKRTYSNSKCKPTCCDTDFCNAGCNSSSSIPILSNSTPPSKVTLSSAPPTSIPFNSSTHTITRSTSTQLSSITPIVSSTDSRSTILSSSSSLTSSSTPTQPFPSSSISSNASTCPTNYIHDPQSRLCIKVFRVPHKVSWYMARSICSAIGDTLIAIDNQRKMDFIHLLFNATDVDRYWIGGRAQFDNSTFYWSNGEKFGYTNWGSNVGVYLNQQSNNTGQECVGISVNDNFHWYKQYCSDLMDAFICEHSDKKTTAANTHTCDTYNGYEDIGDGLCLKIYRDRLLSWQDARSHCKKEGSELIILETAAKYKTLELYLDVHDTRRDFWIGGHDKYKNNTFYWVSGQPFTDTDWYTYSDQTGTFMYSQPDHYSPDHTPADCVVTFPSERMRHQWYDDVCSNSRNFICQMI